MQVITRWVLMRLRHQRFDTVAQLDAAIRQLLPSVNERPFQKLPGSRASTFAEIDAPVLMPLPAQLYELARFKTVKVHIDYHVELHGHRYSVPHALVGQMLEARITGHGVELLLRGQRVGLACGELVKRLLQTYKHPEHGYRSCLGLLSLSRRYGNDRLEAACERALALGTFRYRHVRDLLANNRDTRAPGCFSRLDQPSARQCAWPRLLPVTPATPDTEPTSSPC